ncbi:MAG: CRISPR-associated endonuclease Cas2 [Candidatus Pacearchaeota archaeon]
MVKLIMAKKNPVFKYGELTKLVLTHIVDSVFEGYQAVARRKGPGIFTIMEEIVRYIIEVKKHRVSRAKVLRVLENLEKKEIIDLQEKDDKIFVYLKDKNHPKIIEYSIKSLLEFKKKKKVWDGRWFLVFFDVPESQRNKRDYLRKFLKKLGFYPYQKSVYLFPYECEKEVALIKKIVEGAKYMNYVVAERIEDESRARKYFHLPSPS